MSDEHREKSNEGTKTNITSKVKRENNIGKGFQKVYVRRRKNALLKGDLHGTTLSHATSLRHELFRVNQNLQLSYDCRVTSQKMS